MRRFLWAHNRAVVRVCAVVVAVHAVVLAVHYGSELAGRSLLSADGSRPNVVWFNNPRAVGDGFMFDLTRILNPLSTAAWLIGLYYVVRRHDTRRRRPDLSYCIFFWPIAVPWWARNVARRDDGSVPLAVAWWAAAAWGHETGLLTIAERMGLTVGVTATVRVAYGLATLIMAGYVMRTWAVPPASTDATESAEAVSGRVAASLPTAGEVARITS